MNRLDHKRVTKLRRSRRVRKVIIGDSQRPRLSPRISLRHVSAQIIDDTTHNTLVYVTTVGQKDTGHTMTDKAIWAGKTLAKKAGLKKIKRVVFDKGPKLYHGRIKALADAAREAGLEF